MHQHHFDNMTADELRRFVDARHEREFQIIDVRQPGEYARGHIPGARLLPLPRLEQDMAQVPDDRALVFYCRSGGRSSAAAELIRTANHTDQPVYHLSGGIMAWDGRRLQEMPRLAVIQAAGNYSDRLWAAMNLEKGAWRFYQRAREVGGDPTIADTFGPLVDAEFAHAKAIHTLWVRETAEPVPFEDAFEALAGDVLEGGRPVADVVAELADDPPTHALSLVELALSIEVEA